MQLHVLALLAVLAAATAACARPDGSATAMMAAGGRRQLRAGPAQMLDPFGSFTSRAEALAALQQALAVDWSAATPGHGGVAKINVNVSLLSSSAFRQRLCSGSFHSFILSFS